MIEQVSNAVKFFAFFVESKLGKTGLTVTVDIWGPGDTEIVTGGSATELGDGLYFYTLASGSTGTAGEYVAVFKTATTSVDQQHIPALWSIGRAGVENLDAAVSSRNATTPPTAAAIADQVWDEGASGHVASGSMGALLGAAGAASDPLLNAVPGSYAGGTAGAALGRIGSAQITTTSPVGQSGDINITVGDTYQVDQARQLDWTDTGNAWPVLTAATIVVTINGVAHNGSVVTATGDSKKVRLELSAAQTTAIGRGVRDYYVRATLSDGDVVTLVVGRLLAKSPGDG